MCGLYDLAHAYVIHMIVMTIHSFVWRESFTFVPWLMHVWRGLWWPVGWLWNSGICTWLIQMRNMTHVCDMTQSYVCGMIYSSGPDSGGGLLVIRMKDSCQSSYAWRIHANRRNESCRWFERVMNVECLTHLSESWMWHVSRSHVTSMNHQRLNDLLATGLEPRNESQIMNESQMINESHMMNLVTNDDWVTKDELVTKWVSESLLSQRTMAAQHELYDTCVWQCVAVCCRSWFV
jgi:hypothetical protein